MTQLTPPMSNDDENKRPITTTTVKNRSNNNNNELSSQKDKKSSHQIQYKILQRGQPDESTPIIKKSQLQNELNTSENSTIIKSQRNRRMF